MRKIIKKFIPKNVRLHLKNFKTVISPNKYVVLDKSNLTYSQDLLYTFHNADFMHNEKFIKAYDLGRSIDRDKVIKNDDIHWRIYNLCWAATQSMNLDGDFVDCGVCRGFFAKAVSEFIDFTKSDKKYYLLDTFCGMDEKYSSPAEIQRSHQIGYGTELDDYEQVKNNFKEKNYVIVKGAVPETLEQVKSKKICYLSIDMNCVGPEKAALEFFWDKMVSGGIIILDDYGYANSTNDQKQMHDEFAASHNVMVLQLPTCQGIIIKP